jgi:hypothetical protein
VSDLKARIEHYRAKAAEAEALARAVTDEAERAMYLEAARSWADLVRLVEELQRQSDGR